ncbi:unnamed protein product (macronuclear) [Paramecium tetraurelia]|uniref:Small ribosomal subunit protein eS31 domain-containing protein n=1 Tax=Paramecium tetraurelia TaxID=5888 RepID=A0CXA3_PARTE|nr:uncharacterized protein GSPATT00011052001 [Paramecium tetraurelia]CAK75420.1 unnamed protein product [Paramecium tetraurelia]|eukprot:XP_001442817.1 hypothetical protein (macronuclear) [Paramecium tetraurelia strain d4-2]
MIIKVGHLNGEVRLYDLADFCTAKELMMMIQSETQCEISLVSNGENVAASALLGGESIYYVNVDAEGGKKKKKKKKNFAKPKKKKHRHRKVKLATLKLYTVDGKGLVQRSHKQCPQCPQGVYMAKHFDRHYCGTCHQTFRMDEATIKANLEAIKKQQAAKAAAAAAAAPAGGAAAGGAAGGKKGKKK